MSTYEGQPDTNEIPREMDAVIGMLLLRLTKASADTGKSYYADFYPIDPQHPDQYAVEVNVQPTQGWNGQADV
jgi:hypothetical protein